MSIITAALCEALAPARGAVSFSERSAKMSRLSTVMRTLAVACFLALSWNQAMADDIRVENYKNTVDGLVNRWATAEIALAGKLVPVLEELDKKRNLTSPSDADKARIAELVKQRDALRGKMDEESENLRVELIIVEVLPGAPDRELVVLPNWLKGIIKAKGVPVGHGIILVPDADFDVKKLKLKSFTAGLKFNWG